MEFIKNEIFGGANINEDTFNKFDVEATAEMLEEISKTSNDGTIIMSAIVFSAMYSKYLKNKIFKR